MHVGVDPSEPASATVVDLARCGRVDRPRLLSSELIFLLVDLLLATMAVTDYDADATELLETYGMYPPKRDRDASIELSDRRLSHEVYHHWCALRSFRPGRRLSPMMALRRGRDWKDMPATSVHSQLM